MPDNIATAIAAGDDERLITTWRKRILAANKSMAALLALKAAVEASPLTAANKARVLSSIASNMDNFTEVGGGEMLESDAVAGRTMVATAQDVGGKKVIGYLIGFSMKRSLIPNEFVDAYWKEHGLEGWMKPNEAHESDAFSNACREQARTIHLGNGLREYYDLKEVPSERAYIVHRAVFKVNKDKTETKLQHENVTKIALEDETDDKGTVTARLIRVTPLGDKFEKISDGIRERVRQSFRDKMANITEKQLRDKCRQIIQASKGVNFTMGVGGAWFVPLEAGKRMREYRDFVRALDAQFCGGNDLLVFRALQMIDDYDTKKELEDDVRRHVKKAIEGILDSALSELKGKTDGEAMEKLLVKHLKDHGHAQELVQEYKKILGRDIAIEVGADLGGRLSEIESQTQLSGRVREMLRTLREVN